MDAKIIGKKISKLRESQNMTQLQLADKVNVTNKAVSKWENGGGLPDIALLPDLAAALGVTVEELILPEERQGNNLFTKTSFKDIIFSRSVKRVTIFVIVTLLISFGILNMIWFQFINIAFTPYIENRPWINNGVWSEGGFSHNENRWWKIYDDYNENNKYVIAVVRPSYLRFGGRIVMSPFIDVDPDSIFISLELTPIGIINPQHKYTLYLNKWDTEWLNPLSSPVDRNGHPGPRNPGDSEEYFEKWLDIYEQNYENIIETIEYFNNFFS